MEKYEQIQKTRREIFFNNFLGGIAWALGATVGLSIIIAFLGIILKNLDLVPYVGNFAINVINFIITKNPGLLIK